MPNKTAAVFFDLDGTLVDTAPDMVGALLRLCDEEQQPHPDLIQARNVVSDGSLGLVNLAFGLEQEAEDREQRIQRFLALYAKYICEDSRLFRGIDELISAIETAAIPWGIVTNKPGWLTEPLLKALRLDERVVCQFSGDSLPERKPHPAPMFAAAKAANVDPEHCIYLGDAERDIAAGNAAGMITLTALWGYIETSHTPSAWGADGLLENPTDVLAWLRT